MKSVFKFIFIFFLGFVSSMIIITLTDINTIGHGLQPLVKYIGPSVLGGIIYYIINSLRERIEYLENKLKDNEDNDNNDDNVINVI